MKRIGPVRTCAVPVVLAAGVLLSVILQGATFSDANWVSMGGLSGVDGTVRATAVDDSGNLYIGGQFTIAGDLYITNIAKWDGAEWSGLGSGIVGSASACVYSLVVSGSDLYAGGVFNKAGGVAATNIARWNGNTWSAVGPGVSFTVYALALLGTNLYAGGSAVSPSNCLARWNGLFWSPLGPGVGGDAAYVAALAVWGTNLYVGGRFTTAGGITVSNVAKWNGMSWSALGSGIGGSDVYTRVFALAASDTYLYAGGDFTTAGGLSAKYVARWNGSAWSPVGSGMNNNGIVYALAVSGSDLYAGGGFTTAGGTAATGVAKWNGTAWSALGLGIVGPPYTYAYALAVSGSGLYVGGTFTAVGGTTSVAKVAKWDGSNWLALGSGVNGWVYALAVSGTDLYAGGQFTSAGGISAKYVARWNGSAWFALGSGMDYPVYALAMLGTDLYAGGQFTTAGGNIVNRIARWDGSAWSALGSGMSHGYSGVYVYALAVSGTNLYAGGYFTSAGGTEAIDIARWDGTAWSALGAGISDAIDPGYVYALAASGSELYAAGSFKTAGGMPATNIAKWDGTTWSALGSGLNYPVYALAMLGTDLYAGGQFTTAGGAPATNIARWGGSAWSALGSGISGPSSPCVYALALSGPELYAAGSFTTADGTAATNVAKWNGSAWSALGSGLNKTVRTLAVQGTNLFAGGGFIIAGNKVSAYAAQAGIGAAVGRFGNPVYGPATGFTCTFSDGTIGQPYRIQTCPSVEGAGWSDLTNFTYSGPTIISDPFSVRSASRFYRGVSP